MRIQNCNTSINMDLDNSMLDMKQLFFNNLQLLGFDAPAMEASNHIPFNKGMFELPNKRGAEIVLHYLFQRLNPTMCREAFRDCWPILDKKREQGFRKTCSNWLTNISQEEPDSHLPRINASLFMSPGGEKFYQLLFHFSGYVLQKVLDTELGSKMTDRLKYPVLTSQNLQLGDVIIKDLTCSSIRHRTNYFSVAQLNVKASRTWKDTADEYVKEYRKLNKEIREVDYKVREEEQRSVEASLARGSPGKRRSGQSEHFDPDFDPRTIKRAQRVQQVRDMWKQLEDFDRTEAAEREVVESIVERTINKYKLDAADISVKVPDMLLRECGEEIRRRNVDNTYQGGRLNLVSVLQLWNLCLHLYIEKLNQVGVPKFEEEVQKLTSQVHVQQNYAQNAQTLRQQMSERIPVLKSSIEKLRAKLDTALFQDKSPESIRTTSLGLGLVGPSPQPSFSPGQGKAPAGGIGIPKSPSSVTTTPEAASQITEQMKDAVRRGPDQLFKQPDLLKLTSKPQDPSSIPRPARSQTSSRHSSRPTSARSAASSKGSARSTPKSSKSADKLSRTADKEQSFTKVTTPRSMMEKLQLGDSLRQEADGQEVQTGLPSSQPLSARSDRSDASSTHTLTARSNTSFVSARSDKSESSGAGKPSDRGDYLQSQNFEKHTYTGRKTPTDLLVEEIMGEGKILSPFNSGLEAFETHNFIRRTPDMVENLTRESLTPTNELLGGDNGQYVNAEDIVDIQGPDIDLDNLIEDVAQTSGHLGDTAEEKFDVTKSRRVDLDASKEENITTGTSEACREPVDDLEDTEHIDIDFEGRPVANDGMRWTENVNELNDDVIEGMIEEGIRQVTRDGLNDLEEDTVQYPANLANNRSYHQGDEDVQIRDVTGPELEEEDDMSEISEHSTERAIVIDKSLHFSPQPTSGRTPRELSSPESPEMFIDEEKFPSLENSPMEAIDEERFPSLENSPREAIIIDRSFQTPNRGVPASQLYSLAMNEFDGQAGKPSMSPGLLSLSFQGKPSPVTQTSVSKEFLSRSLVMERSPLSEEIRKMFKKAVEETPPPRERAVPYTEKIDAADDLESPDFIETADQGSRDSSPGYHGNILKQSDISWDLTENLDDIEIPELDQDLDDDIDDLLEANDKVLQLDEENDGDIDDFFTSKTPELPKRRTPASAEMSRTPQQGQGQFERSLGEGSSMEWPKFPQSSSIEDESPLISFTP